jgi:hypothetical protein
MTKEYRNINNPKPPMFPMRLDLRPSKMTSIDFDHDFGDMLYKNFGQHQKQESFF